MIDKIRLWQRQRKLRKLNEQSKALFNTAQELLIERENLLAKSEEVLTQAQKGESQVVELLSEKQKLTEEQDFLLGRISELEALQSQKHNTSQEQHNEEHQ